MTRPDYCQWLVERAWCEVCAAPSPDPDHEPSRGARGGVYHTEALPLCRRHHVEKHAIGRVTFRKKHGLPSYEQIIAKWKKKHREEIESGAWVPKVVKV